MSESEEKRPNAEREKSRELYVMQGVPIHAYLNETGEFRWVPASEACRDIEKAERILQVLKKMPPDRRAVWAQRLDLNEAKAMCPVIGSETKLCEGFDDLCAAYTKPVNIPPKKEVNKGGES